MMKVDYKHIKIGTLIKGMVEENEIDLIRICNFFNYKEEEIEFMYNSDNLTVHEILRWSKLLEYDFFRLYSQHLILYAPPKKSDSKKEEIAKKNQFPTFRKNLYTKELIDFILERIKTKKMTKSEVINLYGIPKTTLYKWLNKYNS